MRPGQPNISPQRQARIAKAVALKLKGKSYRAIASELGVDLHQAYDDVWQHFGELDRAAIEDLEKVRKVELARMDAMLVRLFEIVERPGDELDGDAVKAIVAAAKLMERRAKLLGLDAPAKVEHTVEAAKLSDSELLLRVLEGKPELAQTIAKKKEPN